MAGSRAAELPPGLGDDALERGAVLGQLRRRLGLETHDQDRLGVRRPQQPPAMGEPDPDAVDVDQLAALAGEMSGHTFFKERWYGFDDGLYAGARLLEILARHANPSAVLDALPDAVSTPELNIACAEGEHHALIAKLGARAEFPGATDVIRIDGLRVEYPDGFGLARGSNTTPVIVLRFEADTEAALARIQGEFRRVLREIEPGIALNF